MENENHYQPEVPPETKDAQEFKAILDDSLAGKTEAELTPEQKEAEREFGMKNLVSFLEQIEKEEVMAHGTHNNVTALLSLGIKSQTQRLGGEVKDPDIAKMAKDSVSGDPIWQQQTQGFLLKKIILPYAKLLTEKPDSSSLTLKKEELLKKLPKIGRKRVEWFLDNTVPKFIESGFDPHNFEYVFPFGKEDRDYMEEFEFEAQSLGDKELLLENLKNIKDEGKYMKALNSAMWKKLSQIIGGEDLISSTPAKFLKDRFAKSNENLLGNYGGVIIYFDTPHEIRRYNLGHAPYTYNLVAGENTDEKWNEDGTDDIGVSSTITPSHFKAIRFGNYDCDKRILYLPCNVRADDLGKLIECQNKGVSFFDESLVSIPPLESVQVVDPGYGTSPSGMLTRSYNPNPGQKLIYERMDEIKHKNNNDRYEIITKIVEEKGYKWGDAKES